MRKFSFVTGFNRFITSLPSLASDSFKNQISMKRLFTIGGIIGSFLFSACSEMNNEPLDANSPTLNTNKGDILTLATVKTSDLIRIKGTSNEIIAPEGASNRSTSAAGDDRGRFNISLKFITSVTDQQRQVFDDAAARWERIIIKDVPSITGTIPSAFNGFPPVLNDETVDDIIIEVAIANIDGQGGILGQAGPRFYRNVDLLPVTGVMFFDVADLDFLDQLDLFEEVIVHEMGHVLGVGTAWANFGRTLRQDPNGNPYFNGKTANTHWNAEGGTDFLPIENMFGPGTRLSHWRESVLRNELMTGFINRGVNPLSRITAGSMRDLGYGTAVVGEQYELVRGTPGVDINELAASGSLQGIHIAEMEVILEPIGVVVTDNK